MRPTSASWSTSRHAWTRTTSRARKEVVEILYSSWESEYPGVGYPSCSRALARVPRNTADPNGYYYELGLYPWSSDAEIKSALRSAFRRYHPDGSSPDEARFLRVQEISDALTDPAMKYKYDHTPDDELFVDSEVRAVMDEVGIPKSALSPFAVEELPGEIFFDYFSDGVEPFDCLKSQYWYYNFVAIAPIFHYTRAIRVKLCDGTIPLWYPLSGMMVIPRDFEPSTTLAFALFSVLM